MANLDSNAILNTSCSQPSLFPVWPLSATELEVIYGLDLSYIFTFVSASRTSRLTGTKLDASELGHAERGEEE
jgi:hypothetical protein